MQTTPRGVVGCGDAAHPEHSTNSHSSSLRWRCPLRELASIAATNPWLHPLAPTTPPSLSERFARALEAHGSAEAHDLAACEELAEHSSDHVFKLLIGLTTEDKRRHHSLLQSMVRRMQQEVEFVPSPTAVPVDSATSSEDTAVLNTLRSLIRDEHEGARHLRHLTSRSRTAAGWRPLKRCTPQPRAYRWLC